MKLKFIFACGFLLIFGFAQNLWAQRIIYPNELRGFRFFNQGKLKGIKPGITTRKEIEKIFDKDCEFTCELNDSWRINFSYFEGMTYEITIDGRKTKYISNPLFSA